MADRHYAGIGSRKTPPDVLSEFRDIGEELARRSFVLRSGGADGADGAFEQGCDRVRGRKQIFVPWKGFNGRYGTISGEYVGTGPRALELAARFHPYWHLCSRGARALHARNGYQVLGPKLDDPVEFIVCWTKDAKREGGTGQALRIADHYRIPIYDFGSEVDRALFYAHRLPDFLPRERRL